MRRALATRLDSLWLPALHLCRYGGEDPLRTQSSLAASPHRASGASCGIASLRRPSPPFQPGSTWAKAFCSCLVARTPSPSPPSSRDFLPRAVARGAKLRMPVKKVGNGQLPCGANRRCSYETVCGGEGVLVGAFQSEREEETRDRAERGSAVRGSDQASVAPKRIPSPTIRRDAGRSGAL